MINTAVLGTKMTSIIEADDRGDLYFTFPEPLLSSGQFLPDDEIAMQVKREMLYIKNLSCPVLRLSRFRRNLNSIIRNINNEDHPLKRVLVIQHQKTFWCLPYDRTPRPQCVDAVKFSDEPTKG